MTDKFNSIADIDAFGKAIVEGGEAKLYGIERRPEETDDELAKRVALARDALQ
jgi:hypothetical protein